MALPEPLSDHVAMARTQINLADDLNVGRLALNVTSHLGSVADLIEEDDEMSAAMASVLRAVQNLQREYEFHLSSPDRREAAKARALECVADLEAKLEVARLNSKARALGF